ncbi:unnamed protein product, partial [Prorocentrum cordatum]
HASGVGATRQRSRSPQPRLAPASPTRRGADGGRARGPDGEAEAPAARRERPATARGRRSGAWRGPVMAAASQAARVLSEGAEEDVAFQSLRTSSSAPALLPTRAGPEVPIGEPPSSIGAERRTTVVFRNVP